MPSKKPSPTSASSSSSSGDDDSPEMTSAKRGTGSRSSKAAPPSDSSSSTSSGSDLQPTGKRPDVPSSPVVHNPSKKRKLAAGKASPTPKPRDSPSTPLVHTPSKKGKLMTGAVGNGSPSAMTRALPSIPSVRTPLQKGTAAAGDAENGTSSKKIRWVWTEERVIHLLGGCIEFSRGGRSLSDQDAFLGFFRSAWNEDITKGQLFDKLRKLRALYHRNAEKGESLVFDSVHEENVYKASKQIWGQAQTESKEGEGEANAVLNGKEEDPLPSKEKERPVNGADDAHFAWLFIGEESVYENYVRGHISSIEPSVLKGLVEKETELREKMMKLRLKQLAYEQELMNVVLTRKGAS